MLFVRYAFPPNELGYCGPSDRQELLGYGATGVVDRGLAALARQFDGAWPYLLVRSQPLTWDGRNLGLGEPAVETARRAVDGSGFVDQIAPGDWVSLHWDWVCDRLSPRQFANLRRYTLRQLKITNNEMTRCGPATVLS